MTLSAIDSRGRPLSLPVYARFMSNGNGGWWVTDPVRQFRDRSFDQPRVDFTQYPTTGFYAVEGTENLAQVYQKEAEVTAPLGTTTQNRVAMLAPQPPNLMLVAGLMAAFIVGSALLARDAMPRRRRRFTW